MTTPAAEPVRPSLSGSLSPAPPASGRARYTSVAVAGLLLMAAVPALMLILGLLSGMAIPLEFAASFFAPGIVLPVVAAGLVWRFGLWAKIVGIVVALAHVALAFWVIFGVTFVGSLGDFVPAVTYPLALVMAVGGGIAAIVAARRGRRSPTLLRSEKRILAGAGALVVLAVVTALVVGFVQRDAAAADADAELTATMAEFEFSEPTYEVSPGETIQVHNTDAFAHTFTVPELGIDQRVLPGDYALVKIPADAEPGSYTVYCEPHSDMTEADPEKAGMASTLVVR